MRRLIVSGIIFLSLILLTSSLPSQAHAASQDQKCFKLLWFTLCIPLHPKPPPPPPIRPTITPRSTPTRKPTSTPKITPSPTTSITTTPTPTPTNTPIPTETPSPSPTETPMLTPTNTPTPTLTSTPTPTSSPTPTNTPTLTPTPTSSTTPIPNIFYVVSDTSWKYSDNLESGWTENTFDDSGWGFAAAPSYGVCPPNIWNPPIKENGTQMMWSPNPVEYGTAYFRKTFTTNDPSSGTFRAVFDDNGEIYVNGHLAYSDHGLGVPSDAIVSGDVSQYLQVGQNVIAIEGEDVMGCQTVEFELQINHPSVPTSTSTPTPTPTDIPFDVQFSIVTGPYFDRGTAQANKMIKSCTYGSSLNGCTTSMDANITNTLCQTTELYGQQLYWMKVVSFSDEVRVINFRSNPPCVIS